MHRTRQFAAGVFGCLGLFLLAPTVWAPVAIAPAYAQEADDDDDLVRRAPTQASADYLLDDSLLEDPESRAALQKMADSAEPPGADPATLAQFLYERGKSAIALSRYAQARRDLVRALAIDERTHTINHGDALFALAQAEANSASPALAVGHIEQSIALARNNRQLTGRYSYLAQMYARVGNVGAASEALAKCQAIIDSLATTSGGNDRKPGRRGGGGGGGGKAGGPAIRPQSLAQLSRARAVVQQAQGHYAEAEGLFRELIAASDQGRQKRDSVYYASRRRDLADNLRLQGRLGEAETEIRSVLALYQAKLGAASQRTGTALVALGRLLAEQGRTTDGEALARRGIDVIKASGAGEAVGSRAALAEILIVQYRWTEARAEFEAMRDAKRDDPGSFEALLGRSPSFALTLLKSGAIADALTRFKASYEQNARDYGDGHYATAEAQGFFAAALTASGHPEEALLQFGRAVPVLIDGLGGQDDDVGNRARDQRLRLILEAYMATLLDARGTPLAARLGVDPAMETFRLAEAARGRDTARALAASAARVAADNPRLADMARKEQDLQQEIVAVGGLLADAVSARAEDRDQKTIAALRDRTAALRSERASLVKRINADFPDYGSILNPQPATVADVQKTLHAGEALVAIYSADDRVHTWVVPASGPAVVSSAPIGRLKLDATVKHLRAALDFQAQRLADVPAFDVEAAYVLYAALMGPTAASWAGAKTLFVVPHGPLGELPMQLLPTEAPPQIAASAAPGAVPFAGYRRVAWLARRVAVAQLPSTNALMTLRALPKQTAPRAFVAFGDPLFSREQDMASVAAIAQRGGIVRRSAPVPKPDYSAEIKDLPRLPDTAEEVLSIARVLKANVVEDVFLQKRASEATVRRLDLSQWRIVMFATHGLVPGDLTGLDQPALALSAPDVTGDPGTGLLTMDRIMRLHLNADWVVLSACNTAAGDGSGAEAVSGLGRAFFYAGARSLLVTNWPVESVAARLLTTDLFRDQAENPSLTRAEALRLAMVRLIDGPGPSDGSREVFSYAHPAFWAPFSLIGDGG